MCACVCVRVSLCKHVEPRTGMCAVCFYMGDAPVGVTCVHPRARAREHACVGVRRSPCALARLWTGCLLQGGLLHTAWVLGFAWRSRAPPGTASSREVQATPLPRCLQAWSLTIQGSTEPTARRVPCSPVQIPAVSQGRRRTAPPALLGLPPHIFVSSLRPLPADLAEACTAHVKCPFFMEFPLQAQRASPDPQAWCFVFIKL